MNNFTPDPSTGQILPGSKFGDKLTELAREAKVIVEIGTWKGQGSTWCLRKGMVTEDQFMITVEADREMWRQCPWRHERIWQVWGTIIQPKEWPWPGYYHPIDSADRRRTYEFDKALCAHAPFCLPILPSAIDLLLLDGSEWTSHAEYRRLRDRSWIIALDDTNPLNSIKGEHSRKDMLDNGWLVLADEPEDRNGWFIGRRP